MSDIGDAHLGELNPGYLQRQGQFVGDEAQLVVQLAQLLVGLVGSTDGNMTAQTELHTGVDLSGVRVVVVLCLEQEVGLFLVQYGIRNDEIEAQVINLLRAEDVGEALLLGSHGRAVGFDAAFARVGQAADVARIANLAEFVFLLIADGLKQRNVNHAVEVAVLKVVLDDGQVGMVERDAPATQLTCLGSKHGVCAEVKGDTALIKEHILGLQFQAALLFGADLQRTGECHLEVTHIKSVPEFDALLATGLVLAVLLGELTHTGRVAVVREIHHDVLGLEGVAR